MGKKRNPYLQHTEQRKRDAPHESKEPKVKKQVCYALAAAVHPSEPTPSGGKSLSERATATIRQIVVKAVLANKKRRQKPKDK